MLCSAEAIAIRAIFRGSLKALIKLLNGSHFYFFSAVILPYRFTIVRLLAGPECNQVLKNSLLLRLIISMLRLVILFSIFIS
jgi:hypothetical protein